MGLTHARSLSSAQLHLWGKGQILPYAALISERVTRGLEPDRFAFILPPPGSCSVTNRGCREAVGCSLGLPARQRHRSVCPPRACGVQGSGQPLHVLLWVMAGTELLSVVGAGLGAVSQLQPRSGHSRGLGLPAGVWHPWDTSESRRACRVSEDTAVCAPRAQPWARGGCSG